VTLGHHFQGQNVKGQGHQTALLTAALTRQAPASGVCSHGHRRTNYFLSDFW